MAGSAKHFFTDPAALVTSSLRSQTLLNASLQLDEEHKVIYHRPTSAKQEQATRQRVHVLSGGGSGHEPSFAGFVGKGLLSGAVAGSIFASPSARQVGRAIELLASSNSSTSGVKVKSEDDGGGDGGENGAGVCVIVMNYTGDVLNFGLAVEKAKAAGCNVEIVVVGDDVGVGRTKSGKVGRRGIAGTCLVHKIASALAARGATLEQVTSIAKLVADNIVSVGASLAHVHVPGRSATDESSSTLKEDEVELGMGIHNEDGSERIRDIQLSGLVTKMLSQMLDESDNERAFLSVRAEDETVLLVNNLGGVSPLEFGGIVDEVVSQLGIKNKIRPRRIVAGALMTSLNGLGFSISLLKCQDTGLGTDTSMVELLDAPVEALGWPLVVMTESSRVGAREGQSSSAGQARTQDEKALSNFTIKYSRVMTALTIALHKVIAAEPDITKYDTVVGDGDCGVGLTRGAQGILDELNSGYTTNDAAVLLDRIIKAVEANMDGTSGALYAIFLNALVAAVRSQSSANAREMDVGVWAKALEQALIAFRKYTPARQGDRTLVDALEPFISTLSHFGSIDRAAKAAEQGAQKTKSMKASLGRSVYIGGEGYQEVPDPGAYGLSQFFLGLAQGLK